MKQIIDFAQCCIKFQHQLAYEIEHSLLISLSWILLNQPVVLAQGCPRKICWNILSPLFRL